MSKIFGLLFFYFLLLGSCLFSQTKLTGKVFDIKTKEPLAFVNIIYNSKNLGTTSDLDGNFSIPDKTKIEFITLSYLGYTTKTILKSEIANKNFIQIGIEPDKFILSEVTVFAGENPAHRIINLVIENAKKNNPEKMRSFSYRSYNKFYFTIDPVKNKSYNREKLIDSLIHEQPSIDKDLDIDSITSDIETPGIDNKIAEIFNRQHLFITESVTLRKYKYPDRNQEEVLANRMSGFKRPEFALLATQIQSFSFYSDFISVFDSKYLSPISKGSTKRYFYQIEDSLYNEVGDTTFVIYYRPYKGKNFEGLTGVMHINSNGYALENVTASPYDKIGDTEILIQQKYELIDSSQWFPVQLNTNLFFNSISFDDRDTTNSTETRGRLVGVGKSYISDINLSPDLSGSRFGQVDVKMNKDVNDKDSSFWNLYRSESFSEKDLLTYKVIDSLGEEYNIDNKIKLFKIIMTGKVPLYFINLDLDKFVNYNKYEGFRLGAGIETNDDLLRWMKFKGYFAYGFKDKAWKYGSSVDFMLNRPSNTSISFSYLKDLSDPDLFQVEDKSNFSYYLSKFYHSQFDSITEYSTTLTFSPIRYLSTGIKFSYQDISIINPFRYDYLYPIEKQFFSSEIKLSCRYAYKEKFFQLLSGNRLSMGTEYPILYFNVIKGVKLFNSNHEYLKLEASVSKIIKWRMAGDTYFKISGANTFGDIPYSKLYNVPSNYTSFSMDGYFNTMKLNEFIVDRLLMLYAKHDFRSLLFKTEKWSPRFSVFTMAGWGDCRRVGHADNENYAQTINKGYYESGISVDNIFRSSFSKMGVSISYRYGPYAFKKELDNFSLQFLVGYSF